MRRSALRDVLYPPAAALLIQAVKAWQGEHGKLPASSKEKAAFKDLLRSWQHKIDGVPIEVTLPRPLIAAACTCSCKISRQQDRARPPCTGGELHGSSGEPAAEQDLLATVYP